MKRRIFACLLGFLLLMGGVPRVMAYEYPAGFWQVYQKYEAAVAAGRTGEVIRYGSEVIRLMESAPEGAEKQKALVTTYKQVGLAYAAQGSYDDSAAVFETLYQYASRYEEHWEYAKTARTRKKQYASVMNLYTDDGGSPNYGARNEKENGVLYGICANGGSKLTGGSVTLVYLEVGNSLSAYDRNAIQTAAKGGKAVELALNCKRQRQDIVQIRSMEGELEELSKLFARYADTPFYLRFGAEFDIWDNRAEPEEFIRAFRYVSDFFHSRNGNVAVVWSPSQAANWYVEIEDYYPGDSYVDWVGVSLYANPYFRGDPAAEEDDEIIFQTGINSDPVVAIRDLVEEYGDRKPIMLSESGCGHENMKNGEDTTAFANRRLQEYLCYLPMVYPQIKLMTYFDWYVNGDPADYRLSTSDTLKETYERLTKQHRFIQNSYDSETYFCYRKIGNGTTVNSVFPVSCYAHKYGTQLKRVTYFIDGKYADLATEIPFTAYLNCADSPGRRRLRAVAEFTDGSTLTREADIHIGGADRPITVRIEGNRVGFDQEPLVYRDRAFVPMRKIFEELGAEVSWDNLSQTAVGRRGDRAVTLTVGSPVMYVNHKKILLDASPIMVADRTLVPVRAVAEGLGCDVEWRGQTDTVAIRQKEFEWSAWMERLPEDVDEDLYYVEQRTEYQYRIRERETFSSDVKIPAANLIRTEEYYGDWSEWRDGYHVGDGDTVENRTVSTPKQYHYYHYCTGNLADENKRYRTASYDWCEECIYHDLGWWDAPLTKAEDDTGTYIYYTADGKYRCSNSCWRWYEETTGGEQNQYRVREKYRRYYYWQWSDWSYWTVWSEENPYNGRYESDELDVNTRTVYRYKEK